MHIGFVEITKATFQAAALGAIVGFVIPGGIIGSFDFAVASALATLVSYVVTPFFKLLSTSSGEDLSVTASLARRIFVIGVVGWLGGMDPIATLFLNLVVWAVSRSDSLSTKQPEAILFVWLRYIPFVR